MQLPRGIAVVLNVFSSLFTLPTWQHAQVLLTGAILCQGARRVSTILRVMGLEKEKRFEKYHRVLNRAKWNSMTGAKILLGLMVKLLPPSFPILIAVDNTIERRYGKKITVKGCYRDACRSTQKNIIKCFGLARHCVKKNVTLISRLRLDSALYEFPITPEKIQRGRRREKGKRSQSLKQLASDGSQPWQEIEVNWYGDEKKKVRILSGINLWYSPGEKPLPIRWVLVVDPDSNKAEAFFSTDLQLLPEQIINWFILRWKIEVTFEETRAHLGIETQRQWSPKAIARTTPSLMALFSLTCLFALELLKSKTLPVVKTAWYDKNGEATFSDIIAFVRRSIWSEKYFKDSTVDADYLKIKLPQWDALLDQLARAA